jgi:hypothetical protein
LQNLTRACLEKLSLSFQAIHSQTQQKKLLIVFPLSAGWAPEVLHVRDITAAGFAKQHYEKRLPVKLLLQQLSEGQAEDEGQGEKEEEGHVDWEAYGRGWVRIDFSQHTVQAKMPSWLALSRRRDHGVV